MGPTPSFSDELVAPLLLQTVAAEPRLNDLRRVDAVDCEQLLHYFVHIALDDPAAPGYQSGRWADTVKREGERMTLQAAAWSRRVLRGREDICGPAHRGRLRLRHFGCPSTFHLKELVAEMQNLLPELAGSVSDPFLASRLIEQPSRTAAGALLKSAAAQQGGSLTTAEQLVASAAQGLFTPERVSQIDGDKAVAQKARAVARKKAREALRSGEGVVLNSSHLTACGNSQISACLNAGLAVWRSQGLDPERKLTGPQIVACLAALADAQSAGLCVDFNASLRRQQLIRSRPSGLAERAAR